MDKKDTIFCDIDGTIFKYRKFETYTTSKAEPIISTIKYLEEEYKKGNMIILTTARPEYLLEHTLWELQENFISYHKIIMGIERGTRYLINDMEPEKLEKRAISINLIRDKGI
jgi:hydroxymethylpyrimidine pyrophosphatase-like HAD family hydrolase